MYKYTFVSVAPFFHFLCFSLCFSLSFLIPSIITGLKFLNIVAQRFNYINLLVVAWCCIFVISNNKLKDKVMKAIKNILNKKNNLNSYVWMSNIDNLTTKKHFEELACAAQSAGSYEFIFSEHKFELNYIDGVAAINVTHTNKLGSCLVPAVVLNMIETKLHTNNI